MLAGVLVGGLLGLRVVAASTLAPLQYGVGFLVTLWILTSSERLVFASDRDPRGNRRSTPSTSAAATSTG